MLRRLNLMRHDASIDLSPPHRDRDEGSTNSGDEWLKDCWLSNGMVSFALVYGSILNILQGRNELLEKIIGCVVDSGGVPELDPKVSFFPFV
ncbi:hypothetical protein Tco_0305275 [Tanacetum coccineum]